MRGLLECTLAIVISSLTRTSESYIKMDTSCPNDDVANIHVERTDMYSIYAYSHILRQQFVEMNESSAI